MVTTALFFILSVLFVSLTTAACAIKRSAMYWVFGLMLVSILFAEQTSITFFSEEWYKTATWGINVTLIDLGCFTLLITMLIRPKEFNIKLIPPLTIPFALLFVIGIISWIPNIGQTLPNYYAGENGEAVFPLGKFPLFECWKILRFYFTYWVMTNFMTSQKAYKTLIISFCIIISVLAFRGLFERYVLHIHAVQAGIVHRHILGHLAGMIGCFIFPLIFFYPKTWQKVALLFFSLACLGITILTVGRSSFVGYAAVATLLYFICIKRHFTVKNLIISAFGLFFGVLFLGIALDTILSRFGAGDVSTSLTGRNAVYQIAQQLALQHPFGVGLGNFVAWSSYLGEPDMAHNIFFLTLAETGFLGLIILICLHLRVFQMCIVGYRKVIKNPTLRILILGAFGAALFIFLQNQLHWSSRHNSVAFLQMIMLATISRIYANPEDMHRVELISPSKKLRRAVV